MPRKQGLSKISRRRHRAILIFGESQNDTGALSELVTALRPEIKSVPLRNPLVLLHGEGAGRANIRRNASQIVEAAKAAQVRWDVAAVVVHKDADAVEPAHEALENAIVDQIGPQDFECVPAVPAWEIESWWYLWPDAVSEYHPAWSRLNRNGQEVGLIRNAKETLRRDLRKGVVVSREYKESDSVGIARKVRERGDVGNLSARSRSFNSFKARLAKV